VQTFYFISFENLYLPQCSGKYNNNNNGTVNNNEKVQKDHVCECENDKLQPHKLDTAKFWHEFRASKFEYKAGLYEVIDLDIVSQTMYQTH